MKLKLLIILTTILLISCTEKDSVKNQVAKNEIPPINKSLALKPPMGWNSWDCLGWGATEIEVKAVADYMAKNLKYLGYEYIVIDMLWYGDEAASDFEAFVHETIPARPNYNLDEYGRLLPDTVKYPSSKNGNGFEPLADYIHNLGLKFGIHILRGIPWQASEKHLKIKGTEIDAASVAQPDKGCVWYDGMYGIDLSKPGAQEYYNSIFELYASWGVDLIKADDINEPDLIAISKASRTCGRPIVLSIVPNEISYSVLRENAHMARTGADFWDVWQMVKVGFPVAAQVVKEAGPGFWPDLDMLPVGKLGLKISYKGPDPRISRFTSDELCTLLTLWYISRMPLMIGSYLPETDFQTMALLTNEEALAVNRNSINPRQIKFKNAIVIWTSDIPDTEDKYLAFFNQWESKEPINIKVQFKDLGLSSETEFNVRDLWVKKDLGVFKNSFGALIPSHGAGLYRISRK
jgi:hypothetical protein